MTSPKIIAHALAASALLTTLPSMAQDREQLVLEEVIVSARKREESIMKVPVVVTALSAEQLNRYEVTDLGKISDQVAGLKVGSAISVFGNQVSLRGIGTSVLNGTIDQSVSLNIDGMQMTQGLAYSIGFFDMAQVEVMKGPQALFFGKASPAGVIAIRTADPADDFDVTLRGGYEFEADEEMAELVVSGPVNETIGLRLAARFSDQEGYFENRGVAGGWGAVDPKNDPETETMLLRGTALWQPSDRFNARLKVNYANLDIEGAGWEGQYKSCPDGTDMSLGLPFQFLGGGEDCKLDDTTRVVAVDPAAYPRVKNAGVPFSESEQVFGTLELNYDFHEDLALTSVTGMYGLDQESMINGTVTTFAGTPIVVQGDFDRDDFTQEVRLNYDFSTALNFMIGAFYQDATMDFLVDLPFNQTLAAVLGPLPLAAAYASHQLDIEALSLFGQLLWDVTPELELGVGVRWTDEERKHIQKDFLPTLHGGAPAVTPLAVPKISDDTWAPEITLTYTPTDDLTVFGSLKQAYKSGSFDTSGQFDAGDDASFGDERVRGGEAGIKSIAFDGALQVNAAGYYYKYKDLQVGANDIDTSGNIVIRTTNAGSSHIYGLDLEASYLVPEADGLMLHGAVNWNKGQYDSFDNAQCWGGQRIQDGCDLTFDASTGLYNAQDLSGGELLRAPEWSAIVGVNYAMPVASDMTLLIGAGASYSSEYYTNLLLRKDMIQDEYYKTNASIALSGPGDKWEVAVIGTNLGDEIVSGNCVNGNFQDGVIPPTVISGAPDRGPGGVDELQCTAERGRSVWLRLTWQL